MNFLEKFSELNEDTEIPGLFAIWVGLSTLSCVLGRRVWLDMGTYTIFPNLYVILVAGSGKCRKSTAISVGEKLLYEVDPPLNIISQKTTPSALIKAMKREEVDDENALLATTCEGFVLADELATFLNKNTFDEIGALLIQFYDCKKTFAYHTRERGVEKLTDTCLGLLGASTIDWIKQALPLDAVGGGLTSRMNFVYVPKASPPVPRTRLTESQKRTRSDLIRYLHLLLSVEGEFQLDERAWEEYEKEYIKFYNNSDLFHDQTTSGYASRRGLHLMKIAMLFSLSEDPKLVIRAQHIKKAKEMLALSETFLPMLMSIITANETGILLETVLGVIKQYKSVDRKDILVRVSNRIDTRRLSDLLETLIQSGQVKAFAMGNKIYYETA